MARVINNGSVHILPLNKAKEIHPTEQRTGGRRSAEGGRPTADAPPAARTKHGLRGVTAADRDASAAHRTAPGGEQPIAFPSQENLMMEEEKIDLKLPRWKFSFQDFFGIFISVINI